MTNKLTPASGTNQYSLNPNYTTNITHNGIFEFAKAQNKYYSESTAESRAEVYQPWKERTKHTHIGITKEDMLTINTHVIELLNETFKKEVNKNITLTNAYNESFQNNITLKNKLIKYKDKTVIQALEIKQMKRNYTTRLEQAEKNRKDPHHREQLIKYSLLMLFGFILFGLIKYL